MIQQLVELLFLQCFFFLLLCVLLVYCWKKPPCAPPSLYFSQTKTRFFFVLSSSFVCVKCMFKGGLIEDTCNNQNFLTFVFLFAFVLPKLLWAMIYRFLYTGTHAPCVFLCAWLCVVTKVRTHLLHPSSLYFYACAVFRLWSHESRDHSRLYIIHGKNLLLFSYSHPNFFLPISAIFFK